MNATIFVSIASYRDPETPATLRDLFARAAYPERIRVGVLWQAAAGVDDACCHIPPGVPAGQVRGLRVSPQESQGACWARHRILTELRTDEAYVLQIDSHMRFVDGWDERLIAMQAACATPRALLSTYPIPYTPPDQRAAPAIAILTANAFNHRGILMFLARSQDYSLRPVAPLPNPFLSAGFLFGPAAAFDAVPYDKHLYFIGEEISLAVRLWTHGWDIYTPNEVVVYHYYGRTEVHPLHWRDNPDWAARDERSLSRIRHLLGIEAASDPAVLADLERFGLGTARTLDDYERYADVDLRRQGIGPLGKCGRFPPHPAPARLALQRVFTDIFNANGWGAWETRSGSGSTLPAAGHLQPALTELLSRLSIRHLVDAGCGDVNWMTGISTTLARYDGIDIVEALARQNTRLLGHRGGHFFKSADITTDALPAADAILCRNVLAHLSNAQIQAALRNFAASGSLWLIATTHEGVECNVDTTPGLWRALDLTRAPFALPPPQQRIADGQGRLLGVWPVAALTRRAVLSA